MSKDNIAALLPHCLKSSETYFLVTIDLEGKYIFVNEVFKKRFSFITENFIGKSALIVIYPEDYAIYSQAVEQCLANPEKIVKVDLRKPDTSQTDFHRIPCEFSVFRNKDNVPVGILCLGYDITETERASRQTETFAQKIDTIIEQIKDGFYQLDNQWCFTRINKVAEKILGMPREKLLGKCLWDLFPDTPDYNYPATVSQSHTKRYQYYV